MSDDDLILTTTESVPGRSVEEVLGMVMGNTVRATNAANDAKSQLQNLRGGELDAYSEVMTTARNEALDRLEATAEGADADAVVGVRFQVTGTDGNANEVLVYGTAVRLR